MAKKSSTVEYRSAKMLGSLVALIAISYLPNIAIMLMWAAALAIFLRYAFAR